MNARTDAQTNQGRLRWHSRRALLELDVIFERFWLRHDKGLDMDQATVMEELLEMLDHDLWDMLCGRLQVRDPRWRVLIDELMEV